MAPARAGSGGTRAVLFDAVATLIRPWPSVGSVYARAAASRGAACPARALEAAFPRAYRALSPERFYGRSGLQTSEPRERRWWGRVVALTFERAGCAAPPPAAVAAGIEAFARGAAWHPCAGAFAALAALRARGLKIALVSNYDARLHHVVRELGLRQFFDAVLVSSEVGWAKPSPRIYAAALAALRVAPGEALMVGDRPREDVEGARAAGLRALLYDPRGRSPGPGSVRDLRRIPALVQP
jgi:putative hydrolase of the HAD superfamily